MKYARKMRLVPADQPLEIKVHEPLYERDPVKKQLDEISRDMQNVWTEPINDDERVRKHQQLFLRYQQLRKSKRSTETTPSTITKETIPTAVPSTSIENVVRTVPKSLQNKAKLLMEHMHDHTNLSFDQQMRLTKNGEPVMNTNIIDIVNDLVRKRKNNPEAFGWQDVMFALKESNVPREAIGNDDRWHVSVPETQRIPETPRKRPQETPRTPSPPATPRKPRKPGLRSRLDQWHSWSR